MIKDGWIIESKIYGTPFKQDPIPKSRGNVSLWTPIKPEFITVHNDDSTGSALTEYVDNVENRYVSWHFTVDDWGIYQEMQIIYNGWHCGDGKGSTSGNMTSIGIELCTKGNWQKTRENGIKLICYLMRNVPWLIGDNWIMTIVGHNHWIEKNCPRVILAEPGGMDKFKNDCISFNSELNKPSKVENWEKILTDVSPYAKDIWIPFVKKHHVDGKLNLKGLIEALYGSTLTMDLLKDIQNLLKENQDLIEDLQSELEIKAQIQKLLNKKRT